MDNATGKTQFLWYSQLVNLLVTSEWACTDSWFDCLTSLFQMNHLILEKQLCRILVQGWLESKVTNYQAQIAQNKLLQLLIETYAKLRQVKVFVKYLILAIATSDPDMCIAFSSAFLNSWESCTLTLPPVTIIEIWKLLIEEVKKYADELTVQENSPPSKKRKFGNKVLTVASIVPKRLQCLSVVFSHFLQSLPVLELSSMARNLKQVQEVMTNMENVVTSLLTVCTDGSEVVSSFRFSVLLLVHVWGELFLLLKQYSQYNGTRELAPELPEEGLSFDDMSYIHNPKMTAKQWSHLMGNCTEPNLQYLMNLLAVQKARAILLYGSGNCRGTTKTVEVVTSHLAKSLSEGNLTYILWNGQISSVDNESLLVALWDMVSTNMAIFLPFYGLADLELISDFIISTFFIQKFKKPPSSINKMFSALDITKQLLKSERFTESNNFQSCLITSVIECILKSTPKKHQMTSLRQVLSLLVDKSIDWIELANTKPRFLRESTRSKLGNQSEENLNLAWLHLQMAANKLDEIMVSESTVKETPINKEEQEILSLCLQVVSYLPVEFLLPVNHTRILLALLTTDKVLQRCCTTQDNSQAIMKSLAFCRQLFVKVFVGSRKIVLFDLIDVGDLLLCVYNSFSVYFEQQNNSEELNHSFFKTTTLKMMSKLIQNAYKMENWSTTLDQFITELISLLKKLKTMRDSPDLILTIVTAVLRELTTTLDKFSGKEIGRKTLEKHINEISEATKEALTIVLAKTDIWEKDQLLLYIDLCTALLQSKTIVKKVNKQISYSLEEINTSLLLLNQVKDTGLDWSLPEITRQLMFMKTAIPCLIDVEMSPTIKSYLMNATSFMVSLPKFPNVNFESDEEDEFIKVYKDCMIVLFNTCDPTHLSTIIKFLLRMLEVENILNEKTGQLMSLACLRGIFEGKLPTHCLNLIKEMVDKVVPSCLALLRYTVIESPVSSFGCLKHIFLLFHTIIAKKLFDGQTMLSILFGCLLIPLKDLQPFDFAAVFTAKFNVVNEMFLQHPKLCLSSFSGYYPVLKELMCAIIQQGNQNSSLQQILDEQHLIICAKNVQRLLTTISSYKNEVCKVAPFVIADYVCALQTGTLRAGVKEALVEGLYNLMDICDQHGIAFLHTVLPEGVREVFKSFYNDYNKYHKYKGRV